MLGRKENLEMHACSKLFLHKAAFTKKGELQGKSGDIFPGFGFESDRRHEQHCFSKLAIVFV